MIKHHWEAGHTKPKHKFEPSDDVNTFWGDHINPDADWSKEDLITVIKQNCVFMREFVWLADKLCDEINELKAISGADPK